MVDHRGPTPDESPIELKDNTLSIIPSVPQIYIIIFAILTFKLKTTLNMCLHPLLKLMHVKEGMVVNNSGLVLGFLSLSHILLINQLSSHLFWFLQVCLVLLGAKDVPINRVGPTLFIRIKVLRKCGSFSVDTHEVPTYPDPVWRKMYMFKFETSTEGVVLQLRSTSTGLFSTTSKLLGEAYLTWDDLLASPSLSIRKWLPLNKRKFSPFSATTSPTCTALNVSASITPPIAAPYLLRTLDESGQIYNAKDGAFDAERIVFDHTDKEIITVRLKYVTYIKNLCSTILMFHFCHLLLNVWSFGSGGCLSTFKILPWTEGFQP